MITSIRKKAQEVSFVLLRIAGYIRHKELAARLESISYQLIESLYSEDIKTAIAKVEAAIGLSSLASNIGEMNPNNTAIVLRELESLKNGMVQYWETRDVREMPSVEGLFSKLPLAAPAKQLRNQVQSQKPSQPVNLQQPKSATIAAHSANEANGAAIIRQDAILAKIKQASGSKLQLKDLIAAFPDISERTLRYDLVKLCQIGKLRREGTGGPSNFYVAPSSVAGLPAIPAQGESSPNSTNMGVMNNPPMSL